MKTTGLPTLEVATCHGFMPVGCAWQQAGLAVTRNLEGGHCWHVTHVRSGKRVMSYLKSKTVAIRAAQAMRPLANWCQSESELTDLPSLWRDVRDVRQRLDESANTAEMPA